MAGECGDPASAIRRAYRALLLQVARADLTGVASYDRVVEWLSAMADAALEGGAGGCPP